MKNSWIKFTKPGVLFGCAHFVGDVVEVSEIKAKEIMQQGGCVFAEEKEIEAAKEAIEKEAAAAAAAAAAKGPSNADLLAEIAKLQKQLAERDSGKK